MLEQFRNFIYQRHQLGGAAASLDEALAASIGVYSSHPTAPLTLLARTQGFTADAFAALESSRRAVRMPAMRGSIHLLLRDSAAKIVAATPNFSQGYDYLVKQGKLTIEEYPAIGQKLVAAAQATLSLQAAAELIPEKDSETVSIILRTLCRQGVLLRTAPGSLRGNNFNYIATETWLEKPLPVEAPDEALQWLVAEYLRAYGPVRPADVAWWIGVPVGKVKAAIATLETIEVEKGYLLLAADESAFNHAPAPSKDAVDLLPKWDMLTMGYPKDGRDRFIAPDRQQHIYDFRGDGYGIVLVAGQAAGRWDIKHSGTTMQVTVTPFASFSATVRKHIAAKLDGVAQVMSAKKLTTVGLD